MPRMESYDKRKTSVREHERKTKSGKKTTVKKHDRTLRNKIMNDIERGIYRAEYGLETDSDSKYSRLREGGMSDSEAQFEVYKTRGLLPDKELLDLENRMYELDNEHFFSEGFIDDETDKHINQSISEISELLDAGKTDEAKSIITGMESYFKVLDKIHDKMIEEKKSFETKTDDVIKEWNEGKLPTNKNEWGGLLEKTNSKLASGYWAVQPEKHQELRRIKMYAQSIIEKGDVPPLEDWIERKKSSENDNYELLIAGKVKARGTSKEIRHRAYELQKEGYNPKYFESRKVN